MLDTAGDQQLFSGEGIQHSSALYNGFSKGRQLAVDKEDSEEEDEQDVGEVELFGLKLNGKDVSKVVAATLETTNRVSSKVALQLDEVTEKVNEAVQNAGTHKLQKRQRVTEINSETSEDIKVRKTNLEKDMQSTKQLNGIEQKKALPTVSRRKLPILNRVSNSKNIKRMITGRATMMTYSTTEAAPMGVASAHVCCLRPLLLPETHSQTIAHSFVRCNLSGRLGVCGGCCKADGIAMPFNARLLFVIESRQMI